jgi:hypothetical protein
MRSVQGLPAARQQQQLLQHQQQLLQHQQQHQAARSISSRSVHVARLHPLHYQRRPLGLTVAAGGTGAPQQLSTTDQAQQHDLPSVTTPAAPAAAAAVSTSQCPFAHQAGLSSLASSTSNLVNSIRQQPTSNSTASGSTTQQQQQLSGHGWSVVDAESASGLPAVPGRWCWNPLLGDMLALEAQGAGPFLLQRYRWVALVSTCVVKVMELLGCYVCIVAALWR